MIALDTSISANSQVYSALNEKYPVCDFDEEGDKTANPPKTFDSRGNK